MAVGCFGETVAICAVLVGVVRGACAFPELHVGDVVSLHVVHVFSAVPVLVRVVLCLWLSSHVEPARTGAFQIDTYGILKRCRRRSTPRVRHASTRSGTLCVCVVYCGLLFLVRWRSFMSWHPWHVHVCLGRCQDLEDWLCSTT